MKESDSTDKANVIENSAGTSEPFDSPTDEIRVLLEGLASIKAMRRESTLKLVSERQLTDPAIIQKVEELAAHDPFEYVRLAAANHLKQIGRPVPPVVVGALKPGPNWLAPFLLGVGALLTPFCTLFSIFGACISGCENEIAYGILVIAGITFVLCLVGVAVSWPKSKGSE